MNDNMAPGMLTNVPVEKWECNEDPKHIEKIKEERDLAIELYKKINELNRNWRRVENELPERGYNFLAYYKNQPPLILIAWRDIHDNYIIQGQGDTTGHSDYPKFSHWKPMPKPPIF